MNEIPGKLPELGDPRKVYTVQLDEPQINTIFAFVAFVKAACTEYYPMFPYWKHYREAAERLDLMLRVFDDENAPFQDSGPTAAAPSELSSDARKEREKNDV